MDPKDTDKDKAEEFSVTVAEDDAQQPETTAAPEAAPEAPLSEEPDEKELAQYTDNVQKRIRQLSKKRHDERRAKESAEKDREEAYRFAQAAWTENQQLKQRLAKGETALAGSVASATTAEVEAAKREYKEAMESYDADKIVEAQEKLQKAVWRAEQAKQFQARQQRTIQQQQAARNQPQPQAPQEPQAVQPTPDAKAVAWANENPWFGDPEHDEITAYTVGLHNSLTKSHGNAYATTDEYYERINARLRKRFPEYFGDQGTQPKTNERPATVVAPATRSVPPKTITLTKRQADIARRLNVPLDLYAKQLAALENGNG